MTFLSNITIHYSLTNVPQSVLGNASNTVDDLRQQVVALTKEVEVKDATIRDLHNRHSKCQRELGRVQGELKETRKESQARLADKDSLDVQIKMLMGEGDRLRATVKEQKERIETTPSMRRSSTLLPSVQYHQSGPDPAPTGVQKQPYRQHPGSGYSHHAEQPYTYHEPAHIPQNLPAPTTAQWGGAAHSLRHTHSGRSQDIRLESPAEGFERVQSVSNLRWPSTHRQGLNKHQPTDAQSHQHQRTNSDRLKAHGASISNVGLGDGVAPSLNESGPLAPQASESKAIVLQSDPMAEVDLPVRTKEIFQHVKNFCAKNTHRQWVSIDEMPRDVWSVLQRSCQASSLGDIMKSRDTRRPLAMRYLLSVITADIWQISIVKDFPWPEKVRELAEARRAIATSKDQHVLAPNYIIQAEAVQAIRQHPNFTGFITAKAWMAAESMFPNLSRLFNMSPTATREFQALWRHAYEFGVDIFTLPLAYRFDFPPPGPKAFFNPSTMNNVDPGVSGTPQSIKQADYRVSVAITPVVTITRTMRDRIIPEMVCKAEVLLCAGEPGLKR